MARVSTRELAKFEADFAKSFGEDRLVVPARKPHKAFSTGSLTLDYALGCGGYLGGKITEIWGPENAGKTTLAKIAAASRQSTDPRPIAWLDMERAFDAGWATQHGVDLTRMRLAKPDSSEEVSDMAKKMARSGLFSMIVLDSVGGMISEAEMEKDADESTMGRPAQVITRMIKQATVLCANNDTSMIVINQVRANLSYGADTQSSGPWALRHHTVHKIKLRRTSTAPYTVGSGENQETVGFEIAAMVEKNRVAPPRRIACFALFNQDTDKYGPLGIDQATEAFTMGVRLGVIATPSKGYYVLPGSTTKVNGKDKLLAVLRSEPETLAAIRVGVLAHVADQVHEDSPIPTTEDDEIPDFATGAEEILVNPPLVDA